jgi:hypothetical protein
MISRPEMKKPTLFWVWAFSFSWCQALITAASVTTAAAIATAVMRADFGSDHCEHLALDCRARRSRDIRKQFDQPGFGQVGDRSICRANEPDDVLGFLRVLTHHGLRITKRLTARLRVI